MLTGHHLLVWVVAAVAVVVVVEDALTVPAIDVVSQESVVDASHLEVAAHSAKYFLGDKLTIIHFCGLL